MKRVYIIGSINMDMVIAASRLPQMGETIHGGEIFTNPGGKGANQAVAAQKLGGNVRFCARVGEDEFGEALIKRLQSYGVSTENVRPVPGVSSGVAAITVVGGDNCIVLGAGANAQIDEGAAEEFLQSAEAGDLLLTQLEIGAPAVLAALRCAKQKGMITVLNPAPAQGFREEYLQYVDILIPNETEAQTLGGGSDPEAGIAALCSRVPTVIVTLGGSGCMLCTGKERTVIPCPKVKVVDTTAAGDTFCGALCARLSRGESLKQAIPFALHAASLTVSRNGAQQSIPCEQEVLKFMGANAD